MVLVLVAVGAAAIYALDRRDGGDPTTDSNTGLSESAIGTPVVYGPFRVVPAGWPAGVENSYAGAPAGPLSATSDEDAVEGHELNIEASVSSGFSSDRQLHASKIGEEIVEVRLSLTYDQTAIEVIRWRPVLPFNVERAIDGGARHFDTGSVGDAPAVFYFSDDPPVSSSIWFIEDGVLTQVSGEFALDDLMEIAELIR